MDFDRQKQIAANRAKALERIKQRQKRIKSTVVPAKVVKPADLTPSQKAIIERNRQRALDRQRKGASDGGREGTAQADTGHTTGMTEQPGTTHIQSDTTPVANQPVRATPDALDAVRVSARENLHSEMAQPHTNIRPSIHKSDYIEYDFSTMKDTFGGFLSEETGNNVEQKELSLEDWQKDREDRGALLNGEAPPPLDIANAPTCVECGSIEVDPKFQKVFRVRVCRKCQEKYPEKYSLLTKTECKEDYFLTEPELADWSLFHRIIKENPHSGTFSRMQLFLRSQVEAYAFKKWGGEEALDKEWLRREEMRKNRREKRFNNKLQEMRRKLRAEEITRKYRATRGSEKHKHDWGAPVETGEPHMYKRRCRECGMEVEEIMM